VYGDAEVMRHRSGQLREQAADLRVLADRLVGRAEAAAWQGRAADSMRLRIRERSAQLRELAAGHDSAADALDRHRVEVERLLAEIDAAQRRVETAVIRARVGAAAAGDAPPDEQDHALLAFVPPPPGHRDWLDVPLPER